MRMELQNFRGVAAADEEIAARTLFTGPNGAGKTSRLWAVPWVLHGQTPHGKSADKLADLVGRDGNMSASIDFGNVKVARGLVRKGAGYSQTIHVNGVSCSKAEGEALIAEHCGNFTAALNLDEFVVLSPEERRKFILNLCAAASDVDTPTLMRRLGAATLDGLVEPAGSVGAAVKAELGTEIASLKADQGGELIERYWKMLGEDAREAQGQLLRELSDMATGDMAADLSAFLDHTRRARLDADKELKRLQAALQQVTRDKSEIKVGATPVDKMRKQIDDLQAKRARIQEERGALSQQLRDVVVRTRRLEALKREKAETRERLASANRTLTELGDSGEPADLGALRNALGEADTADRNARQALDEAKDRFTELVRDRERDQRALDEAKSDAWAKALQLSEAAGDSLGWPESEAFAALIDYLRERAPAASQIDALEFSITSLTLDADDAKQRIDELKAEYDRAVEAVHAARGALTQAIASNTDAEKRKLLTVQVNADEGRIKHLTEQIEAMTAEQPADGTQKKIDGLVKQDADLAEEISDLNSKIHARTRYDTLDGELAKCRGAVTYQEELGRVAGAMENAAKLLRESLMDQQLRPLLDLMNEILEPFGFAAYCELSGPRDKVAFDFGWESITGERTSMDQMSDGEAALFAAPLAYALAALSDAPLKILTLEADTIQDDRLYALLDVFADRDDVDFMLVARFREADAGQLPRWSIVPLGEGVVV